MAQIGSIIDGKYEILKEIGRGGMSVVYLAMDNRLNKQWAVKEIKKKGTNSENQIVMQSLISEANLMKRLDHPNLPRIVDIIDNGRTIYIVMDYIEGEPLSKILEKSGAQPQEAVVQWGIQLAEVLDYLHTRTPPIIYRDMKPANIMLKPDGSIKLYDFGIAREYKDQNSSDTISLGTKGYAAPEQFGGMGQTDARTDVFGLGVTLYHLVTGKNPCEPPYKVQPIRDINPQLSQGLEAVITKCTQPDPNERFQSCAEVLYALSHLDTYDSRYRRALKRKLNTFIISIACTLALAVGGAGAYAGYRMTLSSSVNETLRLYGADASDGGSTEKLSQAINDYGADLSQERLNDLFLNYVDVLESDIGKVADDASKASESGALSDSQREETENREIELLEGMDKLIDDHISELNEADQNTVYYKAGSIYMDYYDISDGRFDDMAIKTRYEEAANRYKHISKNFDKTAYGYVKNVCRIGDVISMFQKAGSGLSDNGATLTDEEKADAWSVMSECVTSEEQENRKINQYLIMGNIVFEHRDEYRRIQSLKDEIASFCENAVEDLNAYIAAHKEAEDENVRVKAQKAAGYFKDIYGNVMNKELGGE